MNVCLLVDSLHHYLAGVTVSAALLHSVRRVFSLCCAPSSHWEWADSSIVQPFWPPASLTGGVSSCSQAAALFYPLFLVLIFSVCILVISKTFSRLAFQQLISRLSAQFQLPLSPLVLCSHQGSCSGEEDTVRNPSWALAAPLEYVSMGNLGLQLQHMQFRCSSVFQ